MKTLEIIQQQPIPNAIPPTVELDERVWQAWIAKGLERDRIRFKRRVQISTVLLPALAIAGIIWAYMR
jgi:hypothetical protein